MTGNPVRSVLPAKNLNRLEGSGLPGRLKQCGKEQGLGVTVGRKSGLTAVAGKKMKAGYN